MRWIRCKYCGRFNKALSDKIVNVTCEICHLYSRRVGNKKELTTQQRREIILWAVNQEQYCVECGSFEDLTLDRIIPGSKGGKYEVSNLQILCFKCNTQIKLNYNSVAEAKKDHTHRRCNICGELKELNTSNFHRARPYKTLYRNNSLCNWQPTCKKCRLIKEKHYPFTCIRCGKEGLGWKNKQKFCSVSCSMKYYYSLKSK